MHTLDTLMPAPVRCDIPTKTDSPEIACLKPLGPFMLLSVFVRGYRKRDHKCFYGLIKQLALQSKYTVIAAH